MSRIFRTLGNAYGAACVVCTPYVVPKAYTYIKNDLYNSIATNSIDEVDIQYAKVMSTCVTLSVLPSVMLWSPIITGYLLTKDK